MHCVAPYIDGMPWAPTAGGYKLVSTAHSGHSVCLSYDDTAAVVEAYLLLHLSVTATVTRVVSLSGSLSTRTYHIYYASLTTVVTDAVSVDVVGCTVLDNVLTPVLVRDANSCGGPDVLNCG